ncbi:MAG: TonB-dependent receptor [Balneola sp.]|nr:TonB-dependent receptor [Balneola sp.]
MSKLIRYTLIFCLSVLCTDILSANETTNIDTRVTGQILDVDGEPLPGVNVVVKGTIVGTPTDSEGRFSLKVNMDPPITLQFSYIGYQTQELNITSNETTDLEIVLLEQTILGQDIVVSASRVEESVLEAPVSIEKMDVLAIKNTASDDYYKAIANLKGVDVTTSSINFQIINSRGFNSTGNTRMVQLTDGMDTQAPALNFPIGNLNGPSELDVESIEYIPGAASALYGPNAFNGILLVNSKDPFQYQGLSFTVKSGINHLDGDVAVGEPENIEPMLTTSLRYAKAFNNKFAFKANFSYMKAEDWRGTDFSDKNSSLQGDLASNPAFDGVHKYGDDGGLNIALLGVNPATRNQLAASLSAQTGVPQSETAQYIAALPAQPVNRTGYNENVLIDYGAENVKVNTSLHYRLTDLIEASYSFNYGYGTSVYTGAQRYSLNNFSIAQHKLQLDGDNFMVRAYGTFENSGDSYIADFVGLSVNEAYLDNNTWFGTYGTVFAGGVLQAATAAQGGDPSFNAATVNAILSDPNLVSQFHAAARGTADANRLEPGTAAFDAAVDGALQNTIPNGALFNDKSKFYHADAQYDFKNEIDFMDVLVGGSFRQFQLRSNGTIFDDGNGGIDINEWGAFLQGAKSLADEKLKVTGSIRYDKNENFDGQFSPRISAVATVANNQNIRASFQTGFRNPTTQGQYIDLNVVTARLLGGLPRFVDKYGVTTNTYTIASVNEFTNSVLSGASNPGLLVPFTSHETVKPEQIKAYEVGYKGLLGNNLFIDMAYYYNVYDDFITQVRVRKASGPFTGGPADAAVAASLLSGDASNTFQIYTNNDQTVTAHGAVVGLEYSLPEGYKIGMNYNFNKLIDGLDDGFQNDFNTPEHKVNVSLGNRRVTDNLGFNIAYRWQDEFRWESSFVSQDVDAISTIDAQISYLIPNYKATFKVGGSNLLNNEHSLSGGGPNLGAIYYVSLTFDQLFR